MASLSPESERAYYVEQMVQAAGIKSKNSGILFAGYFQDNKISRRISVWHL